jgi:hypothetical protein
VTVASIIQTIQLVIAPAVMITACAILLAGIQSRYAAVNDRLRLLARERLDLFRRDDDTRLAPPPPANVYAIERLTEIDAQVPGLLRRHRLIRDSLVLVYVAVAIFLLSMLTIAAAAALQPPLVAALALGLFLLATASLLAGVILTTADVWLSHLALQYEVNRVMGLGQ